MSIARAISEQIQLVVQSNDYNYIKKADISDPLFGSLFKKLYSGAPVKYMVRKNGTVTEYPEAIEKETKVIQELRVFHINRKGFYTSDTGLEKFPGRLYRLFTEAKPKELLKFIDEFGFCAFLLPPLDDLEYADGEHEKIIRKIRQKNSHARNLEYLLKKHQTFKALVENFDKNIINLAGINWINRQIMPNISPLLIDGDSFPNREIEDDEAESDEPIKEFLELKKVNVSKIISGYRIFGHFALCCLEFLNDIKNQQSAIKCENTSCNNYFLKSHGNEKYCSEKCRKKERTLQKRQERKIKARLKIKVKKRKNPLPKKNY